MTGVGYIGAALATSLLDDGVQVVGLENGYCTPLAALDPLRTSPEFTLIEGDVANPTDVARAMEAVLALSADPPVVYHLAAQPSAAIAVRDPDYTERANLVGARVVLQAAKEHGLTVVFGGSFRVYGDEVTGQTITEDTPYGRIGDLAHLSKLYVEQLARTIGGLFVSVRLGVVYGLGPVIKTDPPFMTVPNVFTSRAIRGEILEVFDDRPVGFIHLEDAVQALLVAADFAEPSDPWQVVNAVTEVVTIGQVAQHVQRVGQAHNTFVRVNGASSEPATFSVESRLPDSGFTQSRSMGEALGAVWDYFAAGPAEPSA